MWYMKILSGTSLSVNGDVRFIRHPTVSEYGTKLFYGGDDARIESHAQQV